MWNTIFYHPIVNLLLVLYKLVGENLGLSIIAIVIILRLVLWPLTSMQMKSQKRLQSMQPKLQKFKGKNASQMTMKEMGAVKDVGKGCALGCLPTLIQLPFLIALYNALRVLATSNGTVFNDVVYSAFLKFPEGYTFDTIFLGIDLAIIPSQLGFKTPAVIPYLVLALLVAVSQWATTKLMVPPKTDSQKKADQLKKSAKLKGKQPKDEDAQQEMMSSMSGSFTVFLPVMIAVASFSVPAALGVYWFVQSILLAVQTGLPKTVSLVKQSRETGENIFKLALVKMFPSKEAKSKELKGKVVKEGKVEPVKKGKSKSSRKARNRRKRKG